MLKDDFVIQSNIRRMLIRTSINYSRMDFGTVKGVVSIRVGKVQFECPV